MCCGQVPPRKMAGTKVVEMTGAGAHENGSGDAANGMTGKRDYEVEE